jgi:hypothetical protein
MKNGHWQALAPANRTDPTGGNGENRGASRLTEVEKKREVRTTASFRCPNVAA